MRSKLLVVLGIIAIVVPVVIAQQAGQDRAQERPQQQTYQQGQQAQQRMQGEHAGAQKNLDERFLKSTMQSNLFEQEAAKLVADKAPNDQVKEFAKALQQEHQEANEQIKQVAQQKQIQIPNRMENWQQSMLQEMRQLDPETLQNEFLFGTIACHTKDILKHKHAAQKAQDNEVKTLAARQIPTLQQHLQQANRLTEQVTGVRPEPVGVTGR